MDNVLRQENDLPRFRTSILGYNKQDIIEFLNSISSDLLYTKAVMEENKRLKEKSASAKAESDVINSQKLRVAKALMDAQEKADSIIKDAEEKAKVIISKGTAESIAQKEKLELMIKDKEAELKDINDKITSLKLSIKNL